jgi:DNA-binding transcriptional LysR family regulator
MDRLEELKVLLAVIDHGSLIAAARRLRRSASAITRLLATLEQRVGARLIERTTRRLSPTEAGRTLAEQSRVLLGAYEAAVSETAAAPVRGLLRITGPVQFGRRHLTPVVAGFLDAYPETQVELVLNDRNLDLIDEGLDAALRIGALADSSLLVRRVGVVRRVLVASPAYLARRGTPLKPAALAGHDTIFGTSPQRLLEWRFAARGRSTVVRLTPRLLVNEIEAQLIAARAGRGIARTLSYQVADDLAAGTLVRLLQQYELPALPVQLVAVSRAHMPRKVRAFLDYAVPQLAQLAAIHADAA